MATIIVEDGTIVSGANSYISVAELDTYAADRGITILASDKTVLLIKSMDYIESLGYIGITRTAGQVLQFPRSDMIVDNFLLPIDEIPQLLKDGQAETALAIDRSENPLQDVERKVIEEGVDTLFTKYSLGSSSTTIVRTISAKLHKLLLASGSGFRVSR